MADGIAEMADWADVSTEAPQGLRFAAERYGTDTTVLDKAIKLLNQCLEPTPPTVTALHVRGRQTENHSNDTRCFRLKISSSPATTPSTGSSGLPALVRSRFCENLIKICDNNIHRLEFL
jgi:hypothetical protein